MRRGVRMLEDAPHGDLVLLQSMNAIKASMMHKGGTSSSILNNKGCCPSLFI